MVRNYSLFVSISHFNQAVRILPLTKRTPRQLGPQPCAIFDVLSTVINNNYVPYDLVVILHSSKRLQNASSRVEFVRSCRTRGSKVDPAAV